MSEYSTGSGVYSTSDPTPQRAVMTPGNAPSKDAKLGRAKKTKTPPRPAGEKAA